MPLWLIGTLAHAFCGTYVGPADDTPGNGESRLVLVHNHEDTVLTMTSNALSATGSFGLLMPVPGDLDDEDIEVFDDITALEELDAFTAPRVVSYTCGSASGDLGAQVSEGCTASAEGCAQSALTDLAEGALGEFAGVEVKSWITKGIYQMAIVRADDAGALSGWLDAFGFQLAPGAAPLVDDYLGQGVDFMVARITDVDGQDPWLDPIRITYPGRTFTLPLQLGATNARGDQEVLLWVIGDGTDGEAQVLSFPEVQQESDCMVPPDMTSAETVDQAFTEARGDEPGVAVVEYSWDLSVKCDPCGTGSGDPTTFLGPLGKTDPTTAYVTRTRMRFDPLELKQDLFVQYTNSSAQTQLVYIEHRDELEDTFPLCFTGFPAEPAGTCADDSTQAALPWWTLLTLPLMGWSLRRRD